MGQQLRLQTRWKRLTVSIILSRHLDANREFELKFNDSPVSLHSLLFCKQIIKTHINNLQKGEVTTMFFKGLSKGQGHQYTVWQICLCLAVFVFFTGQVSAVVVGNGITKGSSDGNSGDSSGTNSSSTSKSSSTDPERTALQEQPLENYVIEAASLFLLSKSDCMKFLNSYEMSELKGVDYRSLNTYIDDSIKKMERARLLYIELKCKTDALPLNENVLNQLLEFDYYGFAEKYKLVPTIFNQVQYHLEAGDISGIYDKLILNTEKILRVSYKIKSDVENGILPDLETVWDLGEQFSRSFLFGQYVARIFMSLGA